VLLNKEADRTFSYLPLIYTADDLVLLCIRRWTRYCKKQHFNFKWSSFSLHAELMMALDININREIKSETTINAIEYVW